MEPIDVAHDITAVILAGGQGRRMGQTDKGLLTLAGRPFIEHVIARIRPQIPRLALNSYAPEDYRRYGLPVFTDAIAGGLGPLAGLHAALTHCDSQWVLTLPCDTPLLPTDLVSRMVESVEREQRDVCTVSDGQRLHAVIILANKKVLPRLESFLNSGQRRVQDWLAGEQPAIADFSDTPDAFINLNTPEQLTKLEKELCP